MKKRASARFFFGLGALSRKRLPSTIGDPNRRRLHAASCGRDPRVRKLRKDAAIRTDPRSDRNRTMRPRMAQIA
jgi:hypothetical protein